MSQSRPGKRRAAPRADLKSSAALRREIDAYVAESSLEQEQERWLEEEIRRAALATAGFDRRVRIADLRHDVAEAGRGEFDRALRRMSSRGEVALFPLDDRTEIRPQDARDAFDLSGVPQHVLYVPSMRP